MNSKSCIQFSYKYLYFVIQWKRLCSSRDSPLWLTWWWWRWRRWRDHDEEDEEEDDVDEDNDDDDDEEDDDDDDDGDDEDDDDDEVDEAMHWAVDTNPPVRNACLYWTEL